MDGVLPYQPLQGPGHVHYPAHHLLFLVSICEFPALLHAIRQGHRWTFRDHLGDPVPLTVGDIHDPRSVTDGLPSLDGPECSYLRDTIPAVFLSHILLSLIHISEPTRLRRISYAVFCLKKKTKKETTT